MPSKNNKVSSVIVNLPSYHHPVNNLIAPPQNIDNELLRMLYQEHVRNVFLRK